MKVSIASFKGGVGKTMTAIHVATYLSKFASTLLIDGDPNQSAFDWSERGDLPFSVLNEKEGLPKIKNFKHIVIDTEPRTTEEDLEELVNETDLLIVPSTPDAVSLEVLGKTIAVLNKLKASNFKVLLTAVPPLPNRDGEEAHKYLKSLDIPVFTRYIRRYIAYSKASLGGVPVYYITDGKSDDAWQDYVAVGKEVIKHNG